MPLPIFLYLLLMHVGGKIAFTFIVSAIVAIISSFWSKERRIVCLGPQEAGKTTFIDFLLYGKITTIYKGSQPKELKRGKTIDMKDLKIKIPDFNDVHGGNMNYHNWKEEIDQADVCFYILNSRKWKDDVTYKERVNKDLARIVYWSQPSDKQPSDKQPIVFILFNFCDQFSEYVPGEPTNLQNILTTEFRDYHDQELLKSKTKIEYLAISLQEKYIQNSFFYILNVVAEFIRKDK